MTAIILGAIIFSGLGLATWYWTSQTLTYTMTIEGAIVATTNWHNSDLADITTYAEIETASVAEIFPFGNNYIIRVCAEGGNVASVYTKLELTLPGSTTATASVFSVPFVNGVIGNGQNLGTIATDGSESVKIVYGANGDDWFLKSNYAAGQVRAIYFMIDINWDTSLGIGDHDVIAIVSLGDSL